METKHPNYVAIDIATDSLQIQTDHAAWSVPHTHDGYRQLRERLQSLGLVQVVCEASGGYEQALLAFLHQKAVPVSLLNPARVRAFARSEGQRANSPRSRLSCGGKPTRSTRRCCCGLLTKSIPCRPRPPRHNKRSWRRGWIGAPS
jgi:hypothetical protein